MLKLKRDIMIQAAAAILAYVAPVRTPAEMDVGHHETLPDLSTRAAVARDCAAARVETA